MTLLPDPITDSASGSVPATARGGAAITVPLHGSKEELRLAEEAAIRAVVANGWVSSEPAVVKRPRGRPRKNASAQQVGHDTSLSRHPQITGTDPKRVWALSPTDPAAITGQTIFRSRVFALRDSPRLLVPGHNSRKIGGEVTKGPWKGLPIYTLTLEERATCPRTCHHWLSCYGNSMHLARRNAPGREFEMALLKELRSLSKEHRGGFVVRLHVLGDFYSIEYAMMWHLALRWFPAMRVFGYTAWPENHPIGRMVDAINADHPDRCFIRRSSPVPAETATGFLAVTLRARTEKPTVGQSIVCPAQQGRTATCGTCGLCWADAARERPIAFMVHGRQVKDLEEGA